MAGSPWMFTTGSLSLWFLGERDDVYLGEGHHRGPDYGFSFAVVGSSRALSKASASALVSP